MVKYNRFTLVWADKFRELVKDSRLSDKEVLVRYTKYCAEMESKTNKAFLNSVKKDTLTPKYKP